MIKIKCEVEKGKHAELLEYLLEVGLLNCDKERVKEFLVDEMDDKIVMSYRITTAEKLIK